MNNEFSIELAQQLVESEERFPVSLDLVSHRCAILKVMFNQSTT